MKHLFQPIKIRLGLVLLGLLLATRLMALEMTIIPLLNGNAEQLVPVIQQQLGEGSSATAYQNRIILNATVEETSRIRALIETLDSPGRQLRISVKQGNRETTAADSINIMQGANDNGIRMTKQGKTTTTVQRRTTTLSGAGQQGIRATEGQPAYISTGSARVYPQSTINMQGQVVQTRQWQTAETGFWATAWVDGDTASINIEQKKQSFGDNDTLESQQLQTRVHGNLGEWIAVGNLATSNDDSLQSLNSLENSRQTTTGTIYLKVELAE